MRIWLWAVVAALLVSGGCNRRGNNSSEAGTARPTASPGEEVAPDTADVAGAPPAGDNEIVEEYAPGVETETYHGELPPGWPSQVQLYPDAALGETTVSKLPDGVGFSAKLTTAASPAEVSDFHVRQIEAQHGHIAELTIAPNLIDETYFCNDYSMTLQAERRDDETKITVRVNPPVPKDMVQPSMRQYVDLDKVPEGFPEDLLPRYPGSRIINAFLDGPRSSIEMTTNDDLETAAEYYRAHFLGLGWEESSKSVAEIVRAYTYKKDGDKVILNVSSGGSGEPNHITLSFTRKV